MRMLDSEAATEEARAVGHYLAEYAPKGFRDRFSAAGWARIADAVWAAEDALKEAA